MHIVVSTMKDGRLSTVLERKIQLVTIRGLSLSNLRDDWMVRPFSQGCMSLRMG
jgi:myosin-1